MMLSEWMRSLYKFVAGVEVVEGARVLEAEVPICVAPAAGMAMTAAKKGR